MKFWRLFFLPQRLLPAALFALALAAPAHAQRVNLAKYQATAASSAADADPAVFATDGIVGNANRWKSDAASGPHWLSVTLPLAMQLGSAHIYLGRDDLDTVASFSLQWWNGTTWVNIPGAVISGNTATVRNVVFSAPVTSSRVRFYTTESVARVREIALFAPNGPAGYPLGIDVTLNLAKKRPAFASSVDAANFAKNAVDGYADDASRWRSNSGNGPHTLEVDLQVSSRVGSAHLYSGSASSPPISNFTVQYWNGSAWVAAPGGAVTGNTQSAVRVIFSVPVSTSRVRLFLPDNGTQRVRELLVFAANGGDGYPLGTDVIIGPPPGWKWDTFGDGFWKIVNRANPSSLIVSATGASQTQPDTTEEEKHFELLYNLDSDTFRVRNRDSWHCIAAKDAGETPGTAVVELPDYQAMPHEVWRFEDVGSGDYRIVNVWSGLALETNAASPAVVTLATPAANTRQYWRFEYQTHFPKKGIAGYEGEWQRLGTSWSYNWGRDTGISQPAHFVFTPMQYGRWWPDYNTLPQSYSAWHTTSRPLSILGYNEPEQASQGNTPVDEGVALWNKLEQTDMPLVSPAPVNPFTAWIDEFFSQVNAQGLRVDYTAIHWYSPPNADGLINHLQNVFNTYGRPVWLTEFSNIDWGGGATWTDEDCYRFIMEFTWRAEDLIWLKRYSIFPVRGDLSANPWDRNGDSSHFFLSDGSSLTPFGEYYATWDADRTLRDRTAYYLQGLASMHRLRASSTTSAPGTGSIRRSDVSAQFALVPNAAATRHYIVSLRDGRRLRFAGTTLDLAPPGTTGPAVEWTFNGPNSRGYVFIDHPATSKSIHLLRGNDGNGAPTALTYEMQNFGNATDTARWRFIKPYEPEEVAVPPAPASLTATPGDRRVTLSWPASPAEDVLGFSVYRGTAAGGPYTRIATRLTSPSYLDTGVQNGITYRYVVTTEDWIENESLYSPEVAVTPAVPNSTYANWAATALAGVPPAQATFDFDLDRDGMSNGLEYASLTDPRQPNRSQVTVTSGTPGEVLITYPRNRAATDLLFGVVATADLGAANSWQAVATTLVSTVPVGPVDWITVRPAATASAQMLYRVQVWLGP